MTITKETLEDFINADEGQISDTKFKAVISASELSVKNSITSNLTSLFFEKEEVKPMLELAILSLAGATILSPLAVTADNLSDNDLTFGAVLRSLQYQYLDWSAEHGV